jgi:hypothetical protein
MGLKCSSDVGLRETVINVSVPMLDTTKFSPKKDDVTCF